MVSPRVHLSHGVASVHVSHTTVPFSHAENCSIERWVQCTAALRTYFSSSGAMPFSHTPALPSIVPHCALHPPGRASMPAAAVASLLAPLTSTTGIRIQWLGNHGNQQRRGIKTGLIGMPNVGKSTLFNALLYVTCAPLPSACNDAQLHLPTSGPPKLADQALSFFIFVFSPFPFIIIFVFRCETRTLYSFFFSFFFFCVPDSVISYVCFVLLGKHSAPPNPPSFLHNTLTFPGMPMPCVCGVMR